MARMLGRRVWRGQTVEDTPLARKHWRAREKRAWARQTARDRLEPDWPPDGEG